MLYTTGTAGAESALGIVLILHTDRTYTIKVR